MVELANENSTVVYLLQCIFNDDQISVECMYIY